MTPQQQEQMVAQAMSQEAGARTSKEIGDLTMRAIEAETRLAMKEGEADFLRNSGAGVQSQLNGLVAAFAVQALGGASAGS